MDIPITEIAPEQARILLGITESHFIDVKALEVSPANITKAVSAFANTGGGEIYVGVDESVSAKGVERTWRGFANIEAANGHLQAIEGMAPLAGHYEASFLTAKGMPGVVLHLTVSKTREVIYSSNGTAYVRRGAQSLPIQGDEVLQRLKYDKGISSFEDERVDAELNTITNSEVIIDFLLRVVPTAEPDVWLEKQRLIVNKRPTVAGTLLFAEEPQAALAKRSAIKVFRYKTKAEEGERDYLSADPLTVEGPMYELVYGAVDKTKEIVEGIEKLGVEGLQKIQYPAEALHEIITNAVLCAGG